MILRDTLITNRRQIILAGGFVVITDNYPYLYGR